MSGKRGGWAVPFFTIWTGQALSLLGSSVAQFALVWWLTKLTDSATVLATATLVSVLPGVVLGPLAGAYVDRASRKLVIIAADGVVALAALALAYLFYTGRMQVWHVYVVLFVRSVGGNFHFPAMQASTSLMVPKEHLSRVAGLNQSLNGVMSIAGPPLGALFMSFLPLPGIMLVDVATALAAIGLLAPVAIPRPGRSDAPAEGKKPSIWADVGQGIRYVWSWPGLLLLMLMAMALNLAISPAGSLMPLLVTRHFHGEAAQLGWLESAWGVGVVAGGLILSAWGGFRRRIYTSLMGVGLMGVGVLAVGLAPGNMLWLALAGHALAGVMNPMANGPLFAVLQATVAPDYQGRVFTVIGSLTSAMMPLGLLAAGPLSDALGIQVWYVIGGVACALLGAIAFRVPSIVNIEANHRRVALAGGYGQPVAVMVAAEDADVP